MAETQAESASVLEIELFLPYLLDFMTFFATS